MSILSPWGSIESLGLFYLILHSSRVKIWESKIVVSSKVMVRILFNSNQVERYFINNVWPVSLLNFISLSGLLKVKRVIIAGDDKLWKTFYRNMKTKSFMRNRTCCASVYQTKRRMLSGIKSRLYYCVLLRLRNIKMNQENITTTLPKRNSFLFYL